MRKEFRSYVTLKFMKIIDNCFPSNTAFGEVLLHYDEFYTKLSSYVFELEAKQKNEPMYE